jgi:hypothetical protein
LPCSVLWKLLGAAFEPYCLLSAVFRNPTVPRCSLLNCQLL